MTRRHLGRRVACDMLLAMLRHVAALAAGLVTLPLVARALGPDGVGAWALIGTATFALSAADLGLSVAVQRAVVRGEEAKSARAVELSLWVISVAAPLLALVGWLTLDDLPGAPPDVRADVELGARIALAGGVVGAIAVPYRAALVARGAGSTLASARAAASASQVALTAVGLAIAPSLVAPAAALSASLLIETVWLVRAAKRAVPSFPLRPTRRPSAAELVPALRDGSSTLLMNIAGLLALRLDVVVLSRVAPLAAVGAYAVASRAVDQSFLLAKQTSTALLPRLGDPGERSEAVQLGTGVLGGLVASGMTALVLLGQGVLVAWAGPVAARPETTASLALLAGAAIISSGHELAASSLTLGARTPWSSAGPILAGYVVNIAITMGGAPVLGVIAVAGGNLAGALLTSLLLWGRALDLLGWRRADALRALSPIGAAIAVTAVTAVPLVSHARSGLAEGLVVCALATAAGLTGAALTLWTQRARIAARGLS